jgi:hypothetical protein
MLFYQKPEPYIKRTREWIITSDGLHSLDPFDVINTKEQLCDREVTDSILTNNPELDRDDFLDAVAIATRIFLRGAIEAMSDRV